MGLSLDVHQFNPTSAEQDKKDICELDSVTCGQGQRANPKYSVDDVGVS